MPPLPDSVFDPPRPTRRLPAWAGWTAPSWALFALVALVLAGIALRAVASAAWWPASTTLADPAAYAYFAEADPFASPQHPAGYSLFLALVGLVTHSVGAFVVLQHLLGIASALILFAAVRRLCGSPWPGVLGAAAILLGADQLYLEDTIMAETLFTLLLAATLYATARAIEAPRRWWPWPAIAAALAVAATMTRTAGLFLLPVLALALLLAAPRPWLPRWRSLAAFLGVAAALLLGYAGANSISHKDFGIAPTPGLHLYSRAATFADCSQFTLPQGTESLCETTDVNRRPGPDWYLSNPRSPANRLLTRNLGEAAAVPYPRSLAVLGPRAVAYNAKLSAFARAAIVNQPRAYLGSVLPDVKAYFFPDGYERRVGDGIGLDPLLDWSYRPAPELERATKSGMETFFDPFTVDRDPGLLSFLHDYQRVFRFGATFLVFATLLVFVGLFVGPRRSRIAVLVLGVGGLALFVLPTFSSIYLGRYTVPSAGPLAAAAAVAAIALARRLRSGSPFLNPPRTRSRSAGHSPSP